MDGRYSEEGAAALRRHLDLIHRRLQQPDNPGTKLLFLLFGAMVIFASCSMARSFRISQQQEEARREEERLQEERQAVKEVEKRRKQLISTFQRKDLVKVIQAADIHISADGGAVPESQHHVDIEKGSMDKQVEHEKETLGDIRTETVPATAIDEADEDLDSKTDGNTMNIDTDEVIGSSSVTINQDPDTPKECDLGRMLVTNRENAPISIPITCAICLELYKKGQKVVLSGNYGCTHAFHQECILNYLVRYEQDEGPCPCCRQTFMPKQTIKRGGWKKPSTT